MLPLWWQGPRDTICSIICLSGHYFARQLWQGGNSIPRWLMAMKSMASGSPTFFFYPRSLLRPSAPLAGQLPPPQQAIVPLPGSATLALLLSSMFAHLSAACATTRPWPGPAASLLYLALPHRRHGSPMPASVLAGVLGPCLALPHPCWARIRPPRTTQGCLPADPGLALLAFPTLPSLLLHDGAGHLARLLVRQTHPCPLTPRWLARRPGRGTFAWQPPRCCPPWRIRGHLMELMRGGMFDHRRNFLDRLPSGWDWRFRGHLAWQSVLTLVPLLIAWAAAQEPRHPEIAGKLGRSASSPS